MTDIESGWRLATTLTAITAAASGGAFLTFSTLTSSALGDLPDRQGLAAMQQINLAAPRSPLFMALVFGPAILAVVVAARALLHRSEAGSGLIIAGAVVYVLGVVVMTAGFHVPRNDALATQGPAYAASGWHHWLHTWVLGNHVRTLAGLGAALLLVLGARAGMTDRTAAPTHSGRPDQAERTIDVVG